MFKHQNKKYINTHTHMRHSEKSWKTSWTKDKSFKRGLFVSILCWKYETWHRKFKQMRTYTFIFIVTLLNIHIRTNIDIYMCIICIYTSAHTSPVLSHLRNNVHWSCRKCDWKWQYTRMYKEQLNVKNWWKLLLLETVHQYFFMCV